MAILSVKYPLEIDIRVENPPLGEWEHTSGNVGDNIQLQDIIFVNGKYTAVGQGGRVCRSTDGHTWEIINTDISGVLYSITYANSHYIAVGANGAYAKSFDGETWTTGSIGSTNTYRAVTFGNGIFVAVGESGSYARSEDGETWNIGNIGDANFYDILFNENIYIAVGTNGTVTTTTDFSNVNTISIGTGTINAIAYGKGTYVVVGNTGFSAYSYDLTNWSQTNTGMGANCLIFATGLFVASGVEGKYIRSTDGIEWDLNDTEDLSSFNGIAYRPGQFCSVGQLGNYILYEFEAIDDTPYDTYYIVDEETGQTFYTGRTDTGYTDISWVLQDYMNAELVNITLPTLARPIVVENNSNVKSFSVYNGNGAFVGKYMVANDYNNMYVTQYYSNYMTSYSVTGKYNPNDLIFVDANSPDGTGSIVINGNRYNSSNSVNTTFYVDGIYELQFISSGNINSANNNFIAELNGIFVIINNSQSIYSSNDFQNWTVRDNYLNIVGLQSGNNIFVVLVQSINGVVYSQNGTSWTQYVIDSTEEFVNLTYGNGLFYATSRTGVWFSSNATSWTKLPYNSAAVLATSYINGNYVAIASGGTVFYSDNNSTINSTSTNITNLIYTIAYANGYYFAAGSNGNIYYSDSLSNNTWGIVPLGRGQIRKIVPNPLFISLFGLNFYATSINGFDWNYEDLGANIFDSIFVDNNYYIVGNNGYYGRYSYVLITDVTVSVNGENYPINLSNGCERYTLYFVNRLGGRSQLLLCGNCDEVYTNDFTRYKTNYDRTDSRSFENRTIVNWSGKQWVLRTGILTDEQSNKMDDLFTSPRVWLHDHDSGLIYSVIIRDTQVTTKYKRKDHLYYYTINVEQAQDSIRR